MLMGKNNTSTVLPGHKAAKLLPFLANDWGTFKLDDPLKAHSSHRMQLQQA